MTLIIQITKFKLCQNECHFAKIFMYTLVLFSAYISEAPERGNPHASHIQQACPLLADLIIRQLYNPPVIVMETSRPLPEFLGIVKSRVAVVL